MRAATFGRDEGLGRAHALVGRERHVRELGLVVEALVAGRGNLVLLAGDAGMGKTRLAEEADTLARAAGVETAWVTCWAEAGAPPFWPWIELLHDPPIGAYTNGFSIFENPPLVDKEGYVPLPQGSGLGVTINKELIA